MATEHKYARVLRWIADGKTVQFSHPELHGWQDLTRLSQPALSSFFAGEDEWEFRIKPRTVKIGNREVEAPVLEPVGGQELWYWSSGVDAPTKSSDVLRSESAVRDGAYFASPEACRAAHEAWVALMRGEA